MKAKIFTVFFLAFGLLIFFSAKNISASEGVIEIRSTTNEPYRCWASSIRMQNLEYKIPFTCKYLIYPADENVFNYVVWITSKADGKVQKLGTLGLGRGEFKTKTPFSNVFVTTESSKDTKTPGGRTVMKGDIKPITFLEELTSPTPTPTEETPEGEQPQDTQQLSTRDKLVLALKRAGVAALLALVAIVGLIFVVTRSRG